MMDAAGSLRRRAGLIFLLLAGLLLHSPLSAAALCAGDCGTDGTVTVDEVLAAVNIALGAPLAACPNADTNDDQKVTVDEVITAVNNALGRCPADDTPTPTPTASPTESTPTATPTSRTGTPDLVPPTDATALLAWLQAGAYRGPGWTAESKVHPSGGPHGSKVRTYVNDIVLQSLAAGNAAHPTGAALVKELYFTGSTVQGWAVEVKIQADSAGGNGWYWYEGAGLSGIGLDVCTGCHGSGFNGFDSKDYVLTRYPLQ